MDSSQGCSRDCSQVCTQCEELLKDKCGLLNIIQGKFSEDFEDFEDLAKEISTMVNKETIEDMDDLRELSSDLNEMVKVFQRYVSTMNKFHKCNCDWSDNFPDFLLM